MVLFHQNYFCALVLPFFRILIRKLLFSSLQNGIKSINYSETLQSNLIGYFQNFKLAKDQI
jgi:hypothetical protein